MSTPRAVLVAGAMLAALAAGCAPAARDIAAPPALPQASAPSAAATEAVRAGLGRLPVSFVANQGRWDPRAAWVASGSEATAYFLDGGVRWALHPAQGAARALHPAQGADRALLPAQGAARALAGEEQGFVLDQVLVGAREAAPTASVTAPGIVSYFTGETHHAGLPTATELTLEQAWPGVDVVWSGTGGHIEATYRLAPGADPAQVRVAWRGAESVAVTAEGRLGVTTPVRSFEEDAPKAFQDVDGQRVPVEVAYDLDGAGSYGFRLGAYDPARPLVIDPTVLVYAGFLGGSGNDFGNAIAVDGTANAYVTGSTESTADSFPETTGVFQAANGGGVDAFVAKVNTAGSALVYASFLGGSADDHGYGIAVDGAGNAYVTGDTDSDAATFPETTGVFQGANAGETDAFVAKVNPAGSALVYAGFLGGSRSDAGHGIAVDGVGNAYVTGQTNSRADSFPETTGVFQSESGSFSGTDAFVAKVDPEGSALVYASFLGGFARDIGRGIAVDGVGNAYMTGETQSTDNSFPETTGVFQAANGGGSNDAFVAKVNSAGSALVYAGFLGGGGYDAARGIAVDGDGNAYVTGQASSGFPATTGVFQAANGGGLFDAFVAKVDADGSALVYASFLGGSGFDLGNDIAVDGAGNAYVTGQTDSAADTFPETTGVFQAANGGGSNDAFVAKVNGAGSALVYAGFLGGGGYDIGRGIAVDGAGNAYVTGQTDSAADSFPATPGVFQAANGGGSDAFVAKITVAPTISDITDQTTTEDTSTPAVPFTVGDVETPAGSLTLTATSSNIALVPVANIGFGGSGANRTVTLTPAPNQSGTSTVRITVSDGTATAFDEFVLTVTAVNDAPTISNIANGTINEDTSTGPVAFTVGDTETAPGSLTLTRTSSNTALVPVANIVLGGSGAARTVTVTPAANLSGTTTIRITVSDGVASAFDEFVLTVTAVNDAPTISNIANRTVNEDTSTGAVPFTVGDTETAAGSLTLTRTSSNTALVPVANIVFGGSGANRTVTLTPAPNQSGTSTVRITVSDGTATAFDEFVLTVTAVNDAPTISNIANRTVNEDTSTGAVPFTVGDTETAAGSLTLTRTSSNTALVPVANIVFGGSGANRTVTLTPAPNQSGTSTVRITVSDGTATAFDEFVLTVTAVNDAPTISNIANRTVNEDTSTGAVPFTVGDTETAAGSLTLTRTSSNTALVPVANIVFGGSGANRTVTLTPAPNQSGTSTVRITVSDGTATAFDEFVLTVTAVNDAPTISNIANGTINEDTSTGAVPFTVGDTETAAGSLTLTRTSSNTALVPVANIVFGGSGANRTVTLTPAPNQSGTSTVRITVSDGVATAFDEFVLTVTAVNDAPTISNIANGTVNEDTSTGPVAFTVGDVETAAGSLTLTKSSSNAALVPVANIVFGGSGANRTVTLTPAPNLSGTTTIRITVSDGVATAFDEFVLTVTAVNDAPTISNIANGTVNEDTSTGPVAFTVGDVETAAGSLTLTKSSSNAALVPVANIVFGGSGANRTVTLTPAPNLSGTTTIRITVSDGVATAFDEFVLTVTAVNDAPTISNIANGTINEDTSTGPVAFTVGDVETAAGSLTLTRTSTNAALVPVANIVFGGSGANRTVTLTPAPNQSGTSTVRITVSDGTATAFDEFVLTVTAVNDAPTISNIANGTINEDTPTPAVPFTVGDTETAPGSLTLTRTSTNAALVPVANIVFGGSGAARTVTLTPAPNQSGTSTVRITVSDGTATAFDEFVLTVAAVNDAPTISNIANGTINEDTSTGPVAFTVGDTETAPGSLTLTRTSTNAALVPVANIVFGGSGAARTVTVTPAANLAGSTTIRITVSDGVASAFDEFVLGFPAVNDAPTISNIANRTINEDTSTGPVAFTVGDVETPAGSLTLTKSSSNAALVPVANIVFGGSGAARTVTVTPAANLAGSTTIRITVSDGVASAFDEFVLGFPAVNDAPTISNIANRTINEDTSTGPVAFTVGDVETPAGSLTLTKSSSNAALVPVANIVFGGSGAARTVTVTPAANLAGSTTIRITVSDGVASAFDEFVLGFPAVNDAPTISNIANRTVNEDTSTGPVAFTVGDVETPAGSLTLTKSSSNAALVPVANIVFGGSGAARTVTVTPAANLAGSTTIRITVSDGVASAFDEFVLGFPAVNDAPTISNIANRTVNEDTSTGPVAFTVGDVETPAGSLTLTKSSSNAALVPVANIVFGGSGAARTVTVTPAANLAGSTTIRITVSDGVASAFDEFVLGFPAVNDAPTISDIANRTVNEDTSTGPVAFTVGDVETPAGSLTLTRTSTNAALVPVANIVFGGSGAARTVTVTPAANLAGTTTVRITVSDGTATAFDEFVLTVTAVNDAPTISNIADQTTAEGTSTGAVAFTVGDGETPAGSLTLSATSSDPALVPVANVVFDGSGADRTVTVTPAAGQTGSSTIRVNVSDGTASAFDEFVLTVTVVSDAPTISNIADQTTAEGTPTGAVAFTVGDTETAAEDLTLSATSSDPALVPVANVVFGGSGANRTVTVTPAPDRSGTTTIAVTVSDGTATAFDDFVLTVTAVNDAPTISNIADQTTAEGTPTGAVAFTVGDSETAAEDLTLSATSSVPALVPVANIVFGGSGPDRTVTVTPAAGQSGASTIRVTVSDGTASAFDEFVLTVTAANTPPTISDIANRTVGEDTPTGAVAFTVGDGETPAGSLTLSATSSDLALVPVANVVLGGSGATRTVTVTPAPNQSGTATVRMTVSDGALTAFDDFDITVDSVNDVPTISDIANQTTADGTPTGAVAFTVGDTETAAGSLTLSATSSDAGLVPVANVVFGGSETDRTVTVTPAAGQSGASTIRVTVSDGTASAFDEFVLAVPAPGNTPPTISDIADRATDEDTPTGAIAFTVGDTETPAGDLTLSATSSDPTLVPVANVVFGGSGPDRTVTVTPAPDRSGTTTIAVTVRDGSTSATDGFVLTVNPVNDAPGFTKGPDQSVIQDQGAQTVSGWAGDLSTGASEAQSLSFEVTTDNDALFSSLPALSATGTLTYTPVTHATGTATVTVVLTDDGGTANGGVDTSAPQTFTITVVAERPSPLSSPGATFAARVVGSTSGPQDVVLTNTDSVAVVVAAVSVVGPQAGDYAVVSDPCTGESIGAGLSCSVGVSFTPGGPGARSAFLVVTDTAFATSPRSIPLSGTGLPPLSFSVSDVSLTEGNVNAAFVVSLSSTPGAEVKVTYATMAAIGGATSGTDYTPTTNTLTFAAGTTTLDQTLNVAVIGDAIDEPDEDFFVQLYNPTGGSTLFDRWGRGLILNDDGAPPVLSIAAASVAEGNSADGVTVSLPVTLSATPTTDVVVRFATMGSYYDSTAGAGADYLAASGTVTFAAGTTTLTQQVTVAVVEETVVEPDEWFYVQIYNPTGATLNPAARYGKATITNDD